MKSAMVLLSGGMDSSTLLHYVRRTLGVTDVHAVSFFYGQRHARELREADWQAKAVGVAVHRRIDLGFFGGLTERATGLTGHVRDVPTLASIPPEERSQPPTYVPNRNLVLLSLAAAAAESDGIADVFYGAQAQDEYGYWDCTAEFVLRVNQVLALNRKRPVTVHAPFVLKSKAELVRLGLELGVDFAHTWTCYRGEDHPCGTCPSCVERARAFATAGIPDPLAGPLL